MFLLVRRFAMCALGLRVATDDLAAGVVAFPWLVRLCMLVAAVQLTLGRLSKPFKEAQQTSMLLSPRVHR